LTAQQHRADGQEWAQNLSFVEDLVILVGHYRWLMTSFSQLGTPRVITDSFTNCTVVYSFTYSCLFTLNHLSNNYTYYDVL